MKFLKNNNLISFVAELDFKKRYEYANTVLLKKIYECKTKIMAGFDIIDI